VTMRQDRRSLANFQIRPRQATARHRAAPCAEPKQLRAHHAEERSTQGDLSFGFSCQEAEQAGSVSSVKGH
jgi:hypothetical protein